MTLSDVIQGESRLLGFLGANVTLGGVRVAVEKTHAHLISLMPMCNNLLVLVQLGVGIATLVYMILKIRKILRQKD